MSDLIREIEAAQVRAGEAAVIAHLEASGFGSLTRVDAAQVQAAEELAVAGAGALAEIRAAYSETFGMFATDALICETIRDAGGLSDLVRELDVALNGEAGAAQYGTSLRNLVAQVQRQQPVQILNLADGMRINFRAPDGRRATLHLGRLLADAHASIESEDVAATMRVAIAAYPVAGAGLRVIDPDEIGGAG